MQQTLKKRTAKSEQVVQGFIIGFLLLFTLMCLFAFLNILRSSFASSSEIATRTFIIIPREFSLNAYRYILSTPRFYSIGVSLFVTIVGTVLSMILTSFMAYALSRKYLHGRGIFNFIVVFTMLFRGMSPKFYFGTKPRLDRFSLGTDLTERHQCIYI